MKSQSKPVVLVLGSTGQIGGLIADKLKNEKSISLKVSSRKMDQLPSLKQKYGDAVYLDLDDPRTIPDALKGVDYIFLLTGYSVDMLVHSKAVVDAALKAHVKFIVHLGVFTPEHDCYDPHFAWHQMIEVYIKASGIPYTFLHPNCFLQNFLGIYSFAQNGKLIFYTNDKRVGWIALEDVAEATAKILIEGPGPHIGKDYWFSTESLNIYEVATIFSEAVGKTFTADARSPEQFLIDFAKKNKVIDPYFIGISEFCKQLVDGRMAYVADVRDDLPKLIGRKGMSVRDWAILHKEDLAKHA
jgi:uncharacterized protein YbjT (DUF2867 family)